MPPRTANSPGSRTVSVRMYPLLRKKLCSRSSPMRPPGRKVSTRPSKRLFGGTRWISALTVVSTTSGVSPPPVARRVKVSMRWLTISLFGDTRS